MTSRREFLRKSSIVLAASLIVGDEALEAFERLTHRKVWALGGVESHGLLDIQSSTSLHGLTGTIYDVWERLADGMYAHRTEFKPDDPKRWGSTVHYPDATECPVVSLMAPSGLDKVVITSREHRQHRAFSFSMTAS